jgi:hypothetical protein
MLESIRRVIANSVRRARFDSNRSAKSSMLAIHTVQRWGEVNGIIHPLFSSDSGA